MSLSALGSRWLDVARAFPSSASMAALWRLKTDDPSGNHKYLRWMATQVQLGADDYQVLRLVALFHLFRKRVQPRDLYKFKDVQSLARALKSVMRHRSVKLKYGAELVYDSSDFFVLWVPTQAARVYYGRGTKWCIAGKDARRDFIGYASDNMTFYYVLHRRLPSSNEFYKTAWSIGRGKSSGEMHFTTAIDRRFERLDVFWEEFKDAIQTLRTDEEEAEVERSAFEDVHAIRFLTKAHARKLPDSVEYRMLNEFTERQLLEVIMSDPELALVFPINESTVSGSQFTTPFLFYIADSPFQAVRSWVRSVSLDVGVWAQSLRRVNTESELKHAAEQLRKHSYRSDGGELTRHWQLLVAHPVAVKLKPFYASVMPTHYLHLVEG